MVTLWGRLTQRDNAMRYGAGLPSFFRNRNINTKPIHMNKYLSIHDVEDSSVHLFQLPPVLMVHAKTCTDGIALAVLSSETDQLYGLAIPCDKRHYPLLKEMISSDMSRHLEDFMLGNIMNDLHEFVESEDTLFVFERYIIEWIDLLNKSLSDYENYCQANHADVSHARNHHKKNKSCNAN